MVDAQEGNAARKSQRFSEVQADEEGADESRAPGGGNQIHIREADAGRRERLLLHAPHDPQVLPAGRLRHHPAVLPMQLRLRSDDAREDLPVAYDADARVVTRRVDAENDHSPNTSRTRTRVTRGPYNGRPWTTGSHSPNRNCPRERSCSSPASAVSRICRPARTACRNSLWQADRKSVV